MRNVLLTGLLTLALSCQEPPSRECGRFQQGTFRFTATVDGQEETTVFTRTQNLEISEYKGQKDSASVRWINDCEYIVTNLNPKNRGEEKPIHMKILSTSEDSYTFEYKLVGTSNGSRGTAYKVE
ncbi:DNA topoisomerase IV [Robiginitalea marina]|uniref:DNA topoisomerase IV n=1 Tax=Robiginitalea marina TaxID=2954105 RepID=A0ABT1AVG0_9FLAO|nr:DNA topoisomerase IV [Robiginitalea marina]MCO5723597.1 DNA topoisomerase IV [Robiginitalea marina]